jgi:phosphoglycolate phosphatase
MGDLMKKIDLMIFDFDGTLASTGDDLVRSINYTLNALKLTEKPEREIISLVGDGISKLIERVLEQDSVRLHKDAMKIFTDYYGEHLLDKTILYPHAEDVLKNFKNKTKIILTNKCYSFTLMIAKGLKIEKYFAEIIGIDSMPFSKPDRRVIEYLLDKYMSDRENTLIIGDGINDIIAAKNSEILSCAYLNGLGNRYDLLNHNADYYCEDLLEIKSLFE